MKDLLLSSGNNYNKKPGIGATAIGKVAIGDTGIGAVTAIGTTIAGTAWLGNGIEAPAANAAVKIVVGIICVLNVNFKLIKIKFCFLTEATGTGFTWIGDTATGGTNKEKNCD